MEQSNEVISSVQNLNSLSAAVTEHYKNFIVSPVNDSCVRMSVFSGVYPWHRHPNSDELFLVIEGELFIDFKDRETVALRPQDTLLVPAGVIHRTRALQRTVNLCFEQTQATTEMLDEA